MRLFLSSYQFGDYAEALRAMIGEDAAIGVIANAKDYKTADERADRLKVVLDSFAGNGMQAREIDLRVFFGKSEALAAELEKYSLVWLAGGNSFVLARALKLSGGDRVIQDLVRKNQLIYGGESAGAVMAAPTLQGVEFGDDPYIVPEGYTDEEVWGGLGLVPYSIVPHYESDWEGYERMIEVLEEADMPYKTLNDHQVIVVDGEHAERLP